MKQLSFSARFALILTLLGALIAGSTVAIFLALTGGQTRQAALDRVATRAQTAMDVIRAEQASLTGFARTAATQFGDAGDPSGFLVRLSRAAAADDVVAIATPSGTVAARAGTSVDPSTVTWIGELPSSQDPSTLSRSGIAVDLQGRPWIYAWASVPSQAGTTTVAARPLASAAVAQLASSNGLQTGGLVITRQGRAEIDGTVNGQPIARGATLPLSLIHI